MKILKTQTLRGPNYWSIRRQKLILMRLDLEDLAETISIFFITIPPEFLNAVMCFASTMPGLRGDAFGRKKNAVTTC